MIKARSTSLNLFAMVFTLASFSLLDSFFVKTVLAQSEFSGEIKFTSQLGGWIYSSPAIGSDGTIYIGSNDSSLYALDTLGNIKWRFQEAENKIRSSPAIADDGTVYFTAYDGHLYAVDPTGSLKWKYGMSEINEDYYYTYLFTSSPAVGHDGTVYVGSIDAYFYAVNPDGTLKWRFYTGRDRYKGAIYSSPAVGGDGTVYFGCHNRLLYAVGPDGKFKWQYEVYEVINQSPAIDSDGTVYLGVKDTLHAINPDGTSKWKLKTHNSTSHSLAIGSDGTIYLAGSFYNYGGLTSVNPDGTIKWQYGLEGFTISQSTPAVGSDGTIYVGTYNGYIYAVNPDSTIKWIYKAESSISGSPAIGDDGILYFGDQGGYEDNSIKGGSLYALDTGTGAGAAVSPWSMFRQNAQRTGSITEISGTPEITLSKNYVECGDVEVGTSGTAAFTIENYGVEDLYVSGITSDNPAFSVDVSSATVEAGGSRTVTVTFTPDAPGRARATLTVTSDDDDEGTLSVSVAGYALAAGTPATTAGELKFKSEELLGGINTSPAIGKDGTIYVALEGANLDTMLYAISPDGSIKWKSDAISPGGVWSSPTVGSDGTIYVGSRDKYLYAISPDDGALLWKYETGGVIDKSSPAVGSDGTIYIGSSDKYLHAVNPNGTPKWKFNGGGTSSAMSYATPAIGGDGTIYIGSDAYFYAVNPNGTEKWRYQYGGGYSSPAIGGDGTIYVNTSNNLFALNPDSTVKWDYDHGGKTWSPDFVGSPVIGLEGTVYIGADNNLLYALDSYGKLKWTFEASSDPYNPAVGSDGTIYFGCYYGYLYAVNPDGTLKWTYQEENNAGSTSSLTISNDGVIYFGIPGSHLTKYLYGVYTGTNTGLANSAWPKFAHDLHNTGRAGAVVDTAAVVPVTPEGAGELIFKYLTGDAIGYSSPALDRDGNIYIGSMDNYLYAIKPGGTMKWKYETGDDIRSSPAIGSDGTIYIGSDDDYVYALNTDGTLKWKYKTDDDVKSTPAIGRDGTIYIGSDDDYVYALNPDSTLKWRYKTDYNVRSSAAIGIDGTIYVGSMEGFSSYTYALNPDGILKWRYYTGFAAAIYSSPAIGNDGTIYIGSEDDYVYALNPDSTLRWRYKTGNDIISSPAIGNDGTIYIGSTDGYLYALGSDGILKWKQYTFFVDSARTSLWVVSSPAVGSDGTVYIGSYDVYMNETEHLLAFGPDGTLKWSYETGGSIWSSPTISNDGTLYVGSYDGYLYAIDTGTDAGLAESPWPKFRHDLQNTGAAGGPIGPVGPGIYEPNDETEDAYGPLVNGQTYEAFMEDTLDVDWYYFEVGAGAVMAAGQVESGEAPEIILNQGKGLLHPAKVKAARVGSPLLAGVSCTMSLTSLPGDYDIWLFDGATYDILGKSEAYGNVDEQIEIPDLADGLYYVVVLTYSDYSTTDSYLLTVTWEAGEEPAGPVCDFTEDGNVNIADVIALLLFMRENPGDLKADFNQDDNSNIADAIAMLLAIRDGTCPEASLQLSSAGEKHAVVRMEGLTQEDIEYIEEMMYLMDLTEEQEAAFRVALYGQAGKAALPRAFSLDQNSPNPFNPATAISFSLPEGYSGQVTLQVYDLRGRLVRVLADEVKKAGTYTVFWDGTNSSGRRVASGIYLYRLQAGDFLQIRKMVMLK